MTIKTPIKHLDTLNSDPDRLDMISANEEVPQNPRNGNDLPPPAMASIADSGRIRFGAGFRLKPRG